MHNSQTVEETAVTADEISDQAGQKNSPTPESAKEPATIDSEQILQGEQEILISHEGALYRLRRTRSGKLILHK